MRVGEFYSEIVQISSVLFFNPCFLIILGLTIELGLPVGRRNPQCTFGVLFLEKRSAFWWKLSLMHIAKPIHVHLRILWKMVKCHKKKDKKAVSKVILIHHWLPILFTNTLLVASFQATDIDLDCPVLMFQLCSSWTLTCFPCQRGGGGANLGGPPGGIGPGNKTIILSGLKTLGSPESVHAINFYLWPEQKCSIIES